MEKDIVENINSGSRKRRVVDRTSKRKVYVDKDPLGVNFRRPCNHKSNSKFKCSSVTIDQVLLNRKLLYKSTNKIDQDIYLTRLLTPHEPQRRGNYVPKPTGKKVNRILSAVYYVYKKKKLVCVCKKFFLATFNISKARVNIINRTLNAGDTPAEKRGGDRKSSKSVERKNHVRAFINKLPAVESHYNRKKNKRVYLSSEWNVKKIFQVYNDSVPQKFKVSRTMFYAIFNDFNIGFSSPASDVCTSCTLWNNKIKIEKDPLKKQVAIIEKRVHKLRAKCFYSLMKTEVPNSKTFCFDLQQQQPLPKTPIQEAFYSRQISLYNFCVMPVTVDKSRPFLYVWDETEASRGSVEIGSALYDFLCHQFPEDTVEQNCNLVRLFCDGCGGQNKNSYLIHMLMFWLARKAPQNINKVHLTFPVRGHSFLPADRVFGRIEKELKKQTVMTTKQEYIEVFSRHGEVKIIGQDWKLVDLKSLEGSLKKINQIQSLKRIEIRKKRGNLVDVQIRGLQNYRFEENESFSTLLKRGKRFPLDMPEMALRERGLSSEKKRM